MLYIHNSIDKWDQKGNPTEPYEEQKKYNIDKCPKSDKWSKFLREATERSLEPLCYEDISICVNSYCVNTPGVYGY